MSEQLPNYIEQSARCARAHQRREQLLRSYLFAFSVLLLASQSCYAAAGGVDEPGPWGSISLNRHVISGNRFMQDRRYGNARDEYLEALSVNPKIVDIYIGLHEACKKFGDWPQDLSALEKIFELEPTKKAQYAGDYGIALYHAHRYEESVSYLKKGLADINSTMIPSVLPPTTKDAVTIWKAPPVVPSDTQARAAMLPPIDTDIGGLPSTKKVFKAQQFTWRPIVTMEERSKLAENFENACHSECIVVAAYLGYQKGDIHYNHPPKAEFKITKILKGPPLNRCVPIRYEFHDHTSNANEPPAGWKFSPSLMPEKDSEWILFIEHAVPRLGLFDTYEGSYGRQPANEENLNKVFGLLESRGESQH
jgi:tetratricopeptide (TPR) repeat protein